MTPNKSFIMSLISALIVLISIFLSSCVTLKQRERICATCSVKTIIKDSIQVKIIEKTVQVTVHDTISILADNPCKDMCDSLGRLKKGFKEVFKDKKGTTTTLSENNGKLAINEDLTGLKTKATFRDTTIEKFHSKIEQIPQCQKEHRTSFDYFCRWFFYIIGSIILGLSIWKLKRFF